MYNRVYHVQNEGIILISYAPAINRPFFPKKHFENIFSEKQINELYDCIENQPHVIHFVLW